MATLQELKRQIENANALGIKNLADKGVGFAGFPPTTYEIMQGIADIIRDGGDDSGGGIQYTSIVYNDDDTITLIDTDGVTHTMVCVYEDDKLSSVTYDDKEIELHYTDDVLDIVGKTELNLPVSQIKRLYAHYGVDKNEYPYVAIMKKASGYLSGYFFQAYTANEIGSTGYLKYMGEFDTDEATENFPSETDFEGVVDYIIKHRPQIVSTTTGGIPIFSNSVFWSNIVQWQPYGSTLYTLDYGSTEMQNGFALGMASGGVVSVGGGTEEIETLIDESGVLEDTEGTVTDKVEELIDKAVELDIFMHITNAYQLFYQAKSFPSKAVINLPNVTNLYQAFSYWNVEPIPIVEELIINAPNVVDSNSSSNGFIGQMFAFNNGVKKVVFNMSNGIQKMGSLFSQAKAVEEIVLNFSTKNVTVFNGAFSGSTVRKIIGALDFSSATSVNNILANCLNLEEVTFAPNTLSLSMSLANSSLLTSESVQSIIDGLATVTTAQTLTLNKAIALTDEQKATINAKGWTLAQ